MTIRTKNETSNGRDASERRPDTDIDQATPPAAALNVDVFVGSPDPNQVLVRFQNIVDGIVFLPVFVDEHWDLPASELGWMHSDWKSGSFVFDCLPSQASELVSAATSPRSCTKLLPFLLRERRARNEREEVSLRFPVHWVAEQAAVRDFVQIASVNVHLIQVGGVPFQTINAFAIRRDNWVTETRVAPGWQNCRRLAAGQCDPVQVQSPAEVSAEHNLLAVRIETGAEIAAAEADCFPNRFLACGVGCSKRHFYA